MCSLSKAIFSLAILAAALSPTHKGVCKVPERKPRSWPPALRIGLNLTIIIVLSENLERFEHLTVINSFCFFSSESFDRGEDKSRFLISIAFIDGVGFTNRRNF